MGEKLLGLFKTAQAEKIGGGSVATRVAAAARWWLRTAGRWKLNSDAAVQLDDYRWDLGAVVRGDEGNFKAALAYG